MSLPELFPGAGWDSMQPHGLKMVEGLRFGLGLGFGFGLCGGSDGKDNRTRNANWGYMRQCFFLVCDGCYMRLLRSIHERIFGGHKRLHM